MGITRLALASGLAFAATSHADSREIPFWPDAVPAAIHAQVDGVAALETVRELSRFHRVHGSPGLAAAAEHLARKLRAAGLSDVVVEHFPADGETRYAHFPSYLGWNPVEASLEETGSHPYPLARFPDLPVALADYSQDADIAASLVDVGAGTEAGDYDGKDVKGRIVIASGPLPLVHRRACEERGAAGFLSDYPNQTTAWSGDDRDLVRWGHLSPYQTRNTFAFMLSKRQAEGLRQRLAKGETVTVRAHVRAKMVAATYDVVSAVIPGSDPAAGEVVLTAHICHQSAGANDNASGSAAIFETARALQAAIAARTLVPPRRTIRFLWLPEIAGSQAYLIRHPEVVARAVGGIHMDMVGGLLATTHGTFHVSRAAESHPHVVSDIAQAFFQQVERASSDYAERGGDPERGFVWLPGSREAFLGDMRALEMGSDHEVFQEATFGIPMVYFHDWPDVTIHTNKDQPENLDATKLGRVAYLGAGVAWTLAALPETEAPALVAVARAGNAQRLARATLAAARTPDPRDGALHLREAMATGRETLHSIARLWPAAAGGVDAERRGLAPAPVPRATSSDGRIPVRSPEIRGPLDVYYYDHLRAVLGPDARIETALVSRAQGGVLAFEALNLVDGTRSVSEIRDVLSGRYEAVPLAEVTEYLDLLAKAQVIRWK